MRPNTLITAILVLFFVLTDLSAAESVDWHGPGGTRIKDIRYREKKTTPPPLAEAPTQEMAATETAAVSNVIDSPPVDGFVPWIVIAATNKREDADTWSAVQESSLVGNFPSGVNASRDYMIGLFDTGASAHVIGYENAVRAGLFNSTYLTSNYTVVSGVTGEVAALVSYPYGLFVDGLDALEPNTPAETEYLLQNTSGMVGESNVATIIGDDPGSYPDLATAIGSPMSVFFSTHIENNHQITVMRNGTEYTAPRISFHAMDSAEPNYPNFVPLELRPLGASDIQYIPTIDFSTIEYTPSSPSVIIGSGSQSLFFVHSVNTTEGNKSAIDKDGFMIDTGAQVTVIGYHVAALLGLHPDNWEFQVDIEGVTGEVTKAPGFYLDSLTIPAIGDWLEFTNVPVIILEISSPEGGKLDGIIGMNLFTQYNLIFRGGGFFLQDNPRLEFERIATGPVTGDIAPETRDGQVNLLDFSVFSKAWLAEDTSGNWNPDADLAPAGDSQGVINLQDLTVLAENWLTGVSL